jgi:hypothetical protein
MRAQATVAQAARTVFISTFKDIFDPEVLQSSRGGGFLRRGR